MNKKVFNYNDRKKQIYRRRRIAALSAVLIATALATALIVHSCSQKPEAVPAVNQPAATTPIHTDEMPIPSPQIARPSFTSDTKIFDNSITSSSAVLVSLDDNVVLAHRNGSARIYPASMTKVMTLIVAVENIENTDSKFTMTYEIIKPLIDADATRAGFKEGEEVPVRDLLYGMILPSGADASIALAEYISGSEEDFVKLMNKKCDELGLKETHFTNTSGLHDVGNYTTPVEMAMIMDYAMKNELCREVLSTYTYTTSKTPQNPEGIELFSTMFSRMYGDEVEGVAITAGKTGYTFEAGNCLVSYAEKDGKGYILVLSHSDTKWKAIYDTFGAYESYLPVSEPVGNVETTVQN